MSFKTNKNLWIVFLLFTGVLITGIDRSNISVSGPEMMKELGLDPATMGIVFSSFFWGYVLFNLPSGFLADKYGPKIIYGSAAIIWAVSTYFTGMVSSLVILLICRFALGVGEAAVFPVSTKIVNEQFEPERRGTVVGIYMAGYRLGMALAPMGVAYIMQHWGWRISFDISAVITVAWVVLWFATYPKTKNSDVVNTPAKEKKKVSWASVKKLLSHRSTLSLIIIKFLTDYLTYMIITWLPGYLFMERHFTIVKMGFYSSLPWIAGMISLPLIGIISDRLIRRGKSKTFARKVPIVTCQLLASTIVFIPWIDSAELAVALLVFVVAVESAVGGLLWTVPMELAPEGEAGSLSGIMNTAGSIAGILSPIITGSIVLATGSFSVAFLIAGLGIVISAIFMTFILGELKPIHSDNVILTHQHS